MKITHFDRVPLSNTRREYTDEGFLKAPARTARTGIQEYLARELNLDGDPNRVVNVYRPEAEVFSSASLDSYNGVDITNDHPSEMVNAENFKALTIGHVSGAATQDGDYVLANLVVKDANAIKLVESGKAQLSAGYTAEYKDESGTTADGVDYEFIQTDIKINHVALVDNPRAGSMARIFDKQMEKAMIKLTLDNGRTVELEDGVAAQVEDSIKRLADVADAATASKDAAQAKLDSAEEKIASLEAKWNDEAISSRVAAIASTTDSAKRIAGAEFSCDSVDPVEIKRAALTSAMPKRDWADKSAAYVEAAFDMKEEEMEDEDEKEKEEAKASEDSKAQLAKDMATAIPKSVNDARLKSEDELRNAWKQTVNGGNS